MNSVPRRDALSIALPLLFEAQLPINLDLDNISTLTSSLRFITQCNINKYKSTKVQKYKIWTWLGVRSVKRVCERVRM